MSRALPSRCFGKPIHLSQYFFFTTFQYLEYVQIYTTIISTYLNSNTHPLSPLQHLPPVPTPPPRRTTASPPLGAPPLPRPAGAPQRPVARRRISGGQSAGAPRSAAAAHAGSACHHLCRPPAPEKKVDKGMLRFNIFFGKILNGSSAGSWWVIDTHDI